MKKVLIYITFVMSVLHVKAQTVDRQLLSAAGDYFNSDQISMSWSLGELITESYQFDDLLLLQGFQQPHIDYNSIKEESELLEFWVYPNPVTDKFTLELGEAHNEVQLILFNLAGQKTKEQKVYNKITIVDISNYNSGTYYVKVVDLSTMKERISIIEKINY